MADEPKEPTTPETPVTEPAIPVQSTDGNPVQAEPVNPDLPVVPETEPEKKPAPPEKKDEPFVWDGGVENLPDELKSRGDGMLKHMHKVTQEAAQTKRDADAKYNELVEHPEFKEFLKWQETKQAGLPPAGQGSPTISEEELLAAQTDPQHFSDLLNKGINAAVQPLAQEAMKQISQLKYEMELGKREREIESFSQTHKDFWDIDTRIMKAVIEDVVVKNKGSLEDAYQQAKLLDKQYLEKAQSNLNQQIKDKKSAVTASPSKPGEPDVIYADNAKDATRIAYENAALGKRVDVRVRKKKD